jgi:hypothetical protein
MLCVQPRPPESLRLLAAAVAGPAGVVAVRLDAVPVAAVARGREVAETAVLSLGQAALLALLCQELAKEGCPQGRTFRETSDLFATESG